MAYENLVNIIENSDNIVFLGGAGVSTEAIYLISEVLTACILPRMSMAILQKH